MQNTSNVTREAHLACYENNPGPKFGKLFDHRGMALMDEGYWFTEYVMDRMESTSPQAPISDLIEDCVGAAPAQLVYGINQVIGKFFFGTFDKDLDLSDYGPSLGNAG